MTRGDMSCDEIQAAAVRLALEAFDRSIGGVPVARAAFEKLVRERFTQLSMALVKDEDDDAAL